MQPCWDPNPGNRLGFAALCDALVDLGAVTQDDEGDYDDTSNAYVVNAPTTSFDHENESNSLWAKCFTPENRPLLSPSVYHVHSVLAPATFEAVKAPWTDYRGRTLDPPTLATIGHMVAAVGKPMGLNVTCPRDGKLGCAYVDTLKRRDDVGRANALLSYTWGYKILSVASALQRWAIHAERNPKRTYIWVCR
jgi:hypothetical protein